MSLPSREGDENESVCSSSNVDIIQEMFGGGGGGSNDDHTNNDQEDDQEWKSLLSGGGQHNKENNNNIHDKKYGMSSCCPGFENNGSGGADIYAMLRNGSQNNNYDLRGGGAGDARNCYMFGDKTPEGFRSIKRKIVGSPWMSAGCPPPSRPTHHSDRASYIPFPDPDGDCTSVAGVTGGMDRCDTSILDAMTSINLSSAAATSNPVELQVSNLDQTIDQREMKKIITAIFREHVPIIHVSVFFQSDGNMASCVRVQSLQDAQLAISRLHRKKIGFKRILISYNHNHSQNPTILRSKVVSLLQEVPQGKIQLFKFREMFEKRFHNSVGVSDLYKMKDIIAITEEDSGRMLWLLNHRPANMAGFSNNMHNFQSSAFGSRFQSSNMMSSSSMSMGPSSSSQSSAAAAAAAEIDSPLCPIHTSTSGDNKGWAEKENESQLPLINMPLNVLGPNIKNLLKSHGGSAPLASLVTCYNAEFDPLKVDNDGVPMEHLISCIKGVVIQQGISGIKRIAISSDYDPETGQMNYSAMNSSTQPPAPLASQLTLFSRELVDLLKTTSGCRMLFHKFIPSYHHHFGRQCRVADYGYTKLKELFEALPHIVQIMGEGTRALITLSHRAQTKRFTSDLLRVLKAQASKQVTYGEFPGIYEKVINKPFKVTDYGVCAIEDILGEVSETSVVVSGDIGDDMLISIPKREQTTDEVERTRQFASECVELLRHAPDCRLPFNKFIPSYHHHFGRQCRVADYGFTKLIELFEAIPSIVEVTEDCDGERLLQLTDPERMVVIGEQIAALIRSSRRQAILVDELNQLYTSQYGYQLRPDNFGEKSISALLGNFNQLLRLEGEGDDMRVRLSDRSYIKALSIQVKSLLSKKTDGKMLLKEFVNKYQENYNVPLNIGQLKADLTEWIEVVTDSDGEEYLCLIPLQLAAIKIQNLLKDNYGRLLLSEFDSAFIDTYGTPFHPGPLGFSSISDLVQSLNEIFAIRGKGSRRMIVLLKDDVGNDRTNKFSLLGKGNVTSTSMSNLNETYGMMRESQQPQRPILPSQNYQRPPPMTYGSGSPGYPTRYSTLRQEGLRMYPRNICQSPSSSQRCSPSRSISSSNPQPTSSQGSSNNKYHYLNELAQFGLYPSPRGNGTVIGSPAIGSPISSAHQHSMSSSSNIYNMKNPYGMGGPSCTPPPRTTASDNSYYGLIASTKSGSGYKQRSPTDSICGSDSPTSSQHTDESIYSHFTPRSSESARSANGRGISPVSSVSLLRNNSAPSTLGLLGKGSSPIRGGSMIHMNSGPPSPVSPLSPSLGFNPFQFPSPSTQHQYGFPGGMIPASPASSATQGLSAPKSKLGSIFEESDEFRHNLFSSPIRISQHHE